MLSTVPIKCPAYLLEKSGSLGRMRTAVANAGSNLVMERARFATNKDVIDPILIGQAEDIHAIAKHMQWDISDRNVINARTEEIAAETTAQLARDGEVGAVMKGHMHTDVFMGALVRSGTGLRTERRITHVCHLTVPESKRVLMITDGAVNVRPSVDTKMQIILNSVDLAHALGNRKPRVAILSATEKRMPKMRSNIHAVELSERAKKELGRQAFVFGPLSFDIAISPEVARIKGIKHPVAGNADIVVVPDINSGNALLKMMVYFRSACAAGIVLGAKVPIILPGRADSPEASLASAAIAAILNLNQKTP